ncbi:uncharacterized protein [Henckelia pumila]|uniref:uncharacterized protein n=1 Tax=Henckelia pumila TaxID=405737 RepID=UPI003C6E2B8B
MDGMNFVANVKSLCEAVSISMSDFSAQYIARRGRARHQQDEITVEHYFKFDLFNVVIDSQLQELDNKFNDNTVELIILSSTLDPREMHNAFRIDDICRLVQKFYPKDFAEHEMLQLRIQFEHFDHVRQFHDFRTLKTMTDLCQ